MHDITLDHAPLTLALAMFAGVLAQAAARHVHVPGIVLLLVAGVGLGPDGADLIRPHVMGEGLSAIVAFAVAIILFEGGLNLRIEVLRSHAKPIRRLVTVGALVTGALASVVARVLMPWDWRLSILFGTLVIVTGPTVVTPLVRRLRLAPNLTTILIAEGIFIDAVGATIAVVALEIALAGSRDAAAAGAMSIFLRFGAGAAVGAAGGLLLIALLRVRKLVPHGLENVLVLAAAVTTFQVSDALVAESGITAAIVAGLIVGNVGFAKLGIVADFNEQLTDLLVATLFVLLAADVRLDDIAALGWRGAAVVAALMLLVRPATVFASGVGTDLTRNEKLYLSWVAPRGIVAAAVASLFAIELARDGVAGGVEMRALVFVVIAVTVTVQGLTAAPVAQLLRVRLPQRSGFLILGANALGRFLGAALADAGQRVIFVDRSEGSCRAARDAGFTAVSGNGLSTDVLTEAGIDGVRCAVGLSPNEHVNLLFARLIADELRGPELAIGLERYVDEVTPSMIQHHEVGILFAGENDLLLWLDRARRRTLIRERWRLAAGHDAAALAELPGDDILPMALIHDGTVALVNRRTQPRGGDELIVAIVAERRDAATAWLAARGWNPV
ncbi:MAG: sodium:proton antiporter [Kofleriaceae bacterium]|nr:sodium:proton antiporter [Kofleriaceae bacterium]MCB9575314.1 sodium:proton antiporter [Kofleriaceae bacterium]